MQAIAIVDSNWGLSYKNKNLASIPAERKSTLDAVMGKTIIYDHSYLDELPGQQPVKGARNIIYSGDYAVTVKGAEVYRTFEEIEDAIKDEKTDLVYIIRGASIYDHFLDRIDTFHITKIDYRYKADAYLTDLDRHPDFVLTADSDEMYCHDMIYYFLKYERRER